MKQNYYKKTALLFYGIFIVLFFENCSFKQNIKMHQIKKEENNKLLVIKTLRKQMAEKKNHLYWKLKKGYQASRIKEFYLKLEENGKFSDLNLDLYDIKKYNAKYQSNIAKKIAEAMKRIQYLSQSWSNGIYTNNPQLKKKLFKSIIYYATKEINRPDAWFRFHESCFRIPKLTYGTYFIFFKSFDNVEKKESADNLALEASIVMRKLMMQSFTQPKRKDTDNSIKAEQFSNHIHWISGNFAYRPLLESAIVCSNEKMVDVISEVCKKAQPLLSWNNRKEAFWGEGMTSDGAGWGHENQCYIWGYPLDALGGLLDITSSLKGTPWRALDNEYIGGLSNYLDAMSWYQWYQFKTLMSPGRTGFIADSESSKNKMLWFSKKLLKFNIPEKDRRKIKNIIKEVEKGKERTGNRSFWNNDDMIQKRKEYCVGISMISARTISNEIVIGSTTHTDNLGDGTTFIMTHPGEYKWAKGFWNYSALPGTTLKQGKILPHTIWGGYSGTKKFAANVSDGEIGCAGFFSEKEKKKSPNSSLFEVSAVKGYFLFNDEFVALGNSIKNKSKSQNGEIWTTIDQTEWRDNLIIENSGEPLKIKLGNTFLRRIDLTKSKINPWVIEDGVGYIVLSSHTNGKFVVNAEKVKKSNWNKIDRRNKYKKTKPEELDILHLYINHGELPENQSYAYIVNFHLKNDTKMNNYLKNNPIKIISNTASLQAVAHRTLKIREMIFYDSKATCTDGTFVLNVNNPAAIIIKEINDNKIAITVSDPRQQANLKSIKIDTSLHLIGENIKRSKLGSTFSIMLPSTPYCGKSVTKIFNKK